MAAAGTVRYCGTLIMAAAAPGVTGSVQSGSITDLLNKDCVLVFPSATASQTINDNAGETLSFQVVKDTTTKSIKVYASKKQTPQILLDYVVFTS